MQPSANNSMKTLHYLWSSEEIRSLSLQMTVGSELLTFQYKEMLRWPEHIMKLEYEIQTIVCIFNIYLK